MAGLFVEPKNKVASPRNLAITAGNLSLSSQLPTVFLMPPCPAYTRERLIDRDVFFVISDKFAYLPFRHRAVREGVSQSKTEDPSFGKVGEKAQAFLVNTVKRRVFATGCFLTKPS